MKKILLVAGLVLSGMTVSAQFYIGSSLGIYENSVKNTQDKKVGFSYLNFSIAPELGYNLSEKVDIGLSLSIQSDNRKSYQFIPDEMSSKIISTGTGLSPYIRYSFFKFGNFDILGKLALNFINNTSKFYDAGGNQNDKRTSTIIGANIAPLLFYNFSERIALYTQLNFLGLDCSKTTEKTGDYKTGSSTTFNFGVNTDNLVTFDQIRIGFVYKF